MLSAPVLSGEIHTALTILFTILHLSQIHTVHHSSSLSALKTFKDIYIQEQEAVTKSMKSNILQVEYIETVLIIQHLISKCHDLVKVVGRIYIVCFLRTAVMNNL